MEKERDRVRELIGRLTDDPVTREQKKKLRAAEQKLEAAYNAAAEQAEKLTAKENTATEDGAQNVRFSKSVSFADAVDFAMTADNKAVLEFNSKTPYVRMMERTPQIILDKTEAGDHPMLMRFDALYLAARDNGVLKGNYHGLGADAVKKITDYIKKPDVILKTSQKNGKDRIIVLSSMNAKNGQAILSMEINTVRDIENSYNYYNIVITAFDLHENYLWHLFNKYDAQVKYKNEALSQVNPQLHYWLGIINENASTDKVAQKEPVVMNNPLKAGGRPAAVFNAAARRAF